MPSTYSTNLALELIGTGDQAGVWGNTTNTNLGTLIEQAISGYVTQAVATGTDTTITIPNGATGVARNMYIELTGTGGTNTNLIVPSNKKLYFIFNNSTGAVTVKVSGQTGVSVPQGKKMVLVSNGTDIVNGLNYIADFGTNSFTVTNLTATSATITTLTGTSAGITTISSGSANITQLQSTSATITTLTSTSANIATLSGTTATFTSATVTNLALTSVTLSNLNIASANITTLTSASATITNLVNTSASITTLTNNPTFGAGTANGVLYLNASKVATSGSALTFTGTAFNVSSSGSPISTFTSSAATTALVLNNTNANAWGSNLAIQTGGVNAGYFGTIGSLLGNTTQDIAIWATSGNGISFWTNGSSTAARAVIDTSGNVGIGTSSPNYLMTMYKASLPVLQLANSTSGSTSSDGLLMYLNGANATLSNEESGYLRFQTAGTERAVIDSAGNVGIGTSSPITKLNISGGGSAVYQTFTNTAGTYNHFYIGNPQNALTFGNSNLNGSFVANELMRLTDVGNLGIGTSSPGYRLHVKSTTGTIASLDGSGTTTGAEGTGASLLFTGNDGTFNRNWAEIGGFKENSTNQNYASYLSFSTRPNGGSVTERARITSDGNFAIGTTSIAARLDVLGTAGTTTLMRVELPGTAQLNIGNGGASTNYYDANTQIFRSGNATERMRLDSTGLGIGTSSPSNKLTVNADGAAGIMIRSADTNYSSLNMGVSISSAITYLDSAKSGTGTARPLAFFIDGTERMRLDSSGNLGLGVTPSAWATFKVLQAARGSLASASTETFLSHNWYWSGSADTYIANDYATRYFQGSGTHKWFTAPSGTAGNAITFTQAMTLDASGNLSAGTTSIASSGQSNSITSGSVVAVKGALNAHTTSAGIFEFISDKVSIRAYGATAGTGLIAFNTGGGGGSADTERARITSDGAFLINQTVKALANTGFSFDTDNILRLTRSGGAGVEVNRLASDGDLIIFWQDTTQEGSISVSGNTVSYNAFAGSHWSQLQDGSKPDILRGTVMESINELCEWPGEQNERLPKSKISDTAGSKKVYGVFMAWDNDWTETNDMYVTAVGAFICRVNGAVTVQEGDLLESNGDGTARVQADDIIRSSTIGKVTSTVKTHEYDDGSYCVPTVLYCG